MKNQAKSYRSSNFSPSAGVKSNFWTQKSRASYTGWAICSLLAAIAFAKLLSYRSAEAWVLGRYSLPYFALVSVVIGGTLFVALLFYRFRFKAFYFIISIAVGFVVLCAVSIALIELGG